MFVKIANTHAQVLWHFSVGTWKQGNELKLVLVKNSFLWSTGRSNSAHCVSGAARLVWTGRVRSEIRHVRCETGRVRYERSVLTQFARLSAHASDMDRTRLVLHRMRPMCASGVAVTLQSSLRTHLVWTGHVRCDQVVSLVLRFQCDTCWRQRILFKWSRAPDAGLGNTGCVWCELERVRCERRQWDCGQRLFEAWGFYK